MTNTGLVNFDLSSELDPAEYSELKNKRHDLATSEFKFKNVPTLQPGKKVSRRDLDHKIEKEERIYTKRNLLLLDAYSRHVKMVNDYIAYYGGTVKEFLRDKTKDKSISDVLHDTHQFIWEPSDATDTWAKRLAKKYYDRLFHEYCIVDLSYYEKGNIGMRWRTQKEVVQGKGQFICGEKHCGNKDRLASWEVNFIYMENNKKKEALVKARLCPLCSVKLNYKYLNKRPQKRRKKNEHKNVETQTFSGSESSSSSSSEDSEKELNLSNITNNIDEFLDEIRTNIKQNTLSESTTVNSKSDTSSQDQKNSNIWKQPTSLLEPANDIQDKSREEEFDEYFKDMFL